MTWEGLRKKECGVLFLSPEEADRMIPTYGPRFPARAWQQGLDPVHEEIKITCTALLTGVDAEASAT